MIANPMERVSAWLAERAGFRTDGHRTDLLRSRLEPRLATFGLPTLEALAEALEAGAHDELERAVLNAAATNHTYFYREPEVLDALRTLVFPALEGRGPLRIWSAAASSGDEAYTVALMAIERWGGAAAAAANVAILGTDIASVIATAEQGVYPVARVQAVPSDLRARYLEPVGLGLVRVRAEVRGLCTFRRLNLKSPEYPFARRMHVTLCRNVLYYFDLETQRLVLERLHTYTEPGGFLFTSVTEPIRQLETSWKPVAPGVFRSAHR